MSVAYYPGANRTIQYWAAKFIGSKMAPNVVVLHTTEGGGWPDYSGGATAPNLTIRADKAMKRFKIRQHFPLNRSSRALQNLIGGVETNTLNCIQIELIGSCVQKDGFGAVYWPDAPDWCYQALGKVLNTLAALYPAIPLTVPVLWLPYPTSYGPSQARMTGTQWSNFRGICGHQHVPENVHGDPGNLPMGKILAPPPVVHPLADKVLADAKKGVATTTGKRRAAYAEIRDLIKPFTTGGTP